MRSLLLFRRPDEFEQVERETKVGEAAGEMDFAGNERVLGIWTFQQ